MMITQGSPPKILQHHEGLPRAISRLLPSRLMLMFLASRTLFTPVDIDRKFLPLVLMMMTKLLLTAETRDMVENWIDFWLEWQQLSEIALYSVRTQSIRARTIISNVLADENQPQGRGAQCGGCLGLCLLYSDLVWVRQSKTATDWTRAMPDTFPVADVDLGHRMCGEIINIKITLPLQNLYIIGYVTD